MSEANRSDDAGARVVRAAIPGWQSTLHRPPVDDGGARFFAPGRGWLELAVLLSAASILVPACAVAAVGFAVAARRAGNGRATAALIAAVWCGALGVVVRGFMGLTPVP